MADGSSADMEVVILSIDINYVLENKTNGMILASSLYLCFLMMLVSKSIYNSVTNHKTEANKKSMSKMLKLQPTLWHLPFSLPVFLDKSSFTVRQQTGRYHPAERGLW